MQGKTDKRSKVIVTDDADVLITGLSRLFVIPHYTMKVWNERMIEYASILDDLSRFEYSAPQIRKDKGRESLRKRGLLDHFMNQCDVYDIPPYAQDEMLAEVNELGVKNRMLPTPEFEDSVFRCGYRYFTTNRGQSAVELTPNGDHYLYFRNDHDENLPQCELSEKNPSSRKGARTIKVGICPFAPSV